MSLELEEILEKGSHEKIFLSTRITQKEHKMLEEIQGWLQTERSLSTISKQETIMFTIRMAYEYIHIRLKELDQQEPHKLYTKGIHHKDPQLQRLLDVATR